MKQFQKIQWLALALILILGIVGCESLAPDSNVGPTAPVDVSPDPANLANFWVGRGQNKLGVYTSETVLQVEAPAGSFLLKYVTLSGIYYVVFSSEEGVFLAIGLLDGDDLLDVSLWEVPISDTATPDPTSPSPGEGVLIYYWPGSTGVTWEGVVVFGEINWSAEIIIIKDGEIVENPDFVIVGLEQVEPRTFTLTTEVQGAGGFIWPDYLTRIPEGASRSIKFRPYPTTDVLVNGVSVMPIQQLGNGDGHLVIHDIREDIHVIGIW